MDKDMKNKIIRKKKTKKEIISEKVFKFLGDKIIDVLDLGVDLFINLESSTLGGAELHCKIRNYLNRSPYFYERNGNYFVTPRGRIKIIKKILQDKLDKENRWNGYWWAVAFDIPEKRRRARELLRRELKYMHFVEIQKSIWVTPYSVEKELKALLKLWLKDMSGNIKIFKIEKIIDDGELKEIFEIR
jgi:hypothetical protein